MEIFCFVLGILCLYTAHPAPVLGVLGLCYITPGYGLVLFFMLGMFIAWGHQGLVAPLGLPAVDSIPDANVLGTIHSIPARSARKTSFTFAITQYEGQPARGLVHLHWYNQVPDLQLGQWWHLQVKLKKPQNYHNPGSDDYRASLQSKHIAWTGTVRPKGSALVNKEAPTRGWLWLRDKLGKRLAHLTADENTLGVLQALTLNLTEHVSPANWELFRRTGTIHLFGISGEHIALVFGLISVSVHWLWSRSLRCGLAVPAVQVASVLGFVVAALYAGLAGFNPPVQRALLGCLLYTLYCLGKQGFTSWQAWRYALVATLSIEPHAVFMQGFYYSFLAVACLLLTQQRWRCKGWRGMLALQLSCLIGLMPLSLYWFAYGSVNGYLANLFAIPLTSFVIIPLALLALLLSPFEWTAVLIKGLGLFVSVLFKGLEWTEHLSAMNITWSISLYAALALLGGVLLLVVLPIPSFACMASLWLVLPFIPLRPAVKPGEALIQILDVGQGLAVSVRTARHTLLYDTGDKFFQGSDLGKLVIVPFYTQQHIKHLDAVVISHPDKDHSGGLPSVEATMAVDTLIVNDIQYFHRGLNCHSYPPWQWDGVHFRFLPIGIANATRNNSSCILQISNAQGKVLLTGDIEAVAEDYLVRTYPNQLASQVLLLPHHASKTSSTYRFLLEVAPLYAVASLGLDNRFHFPHTKTLNSLRTLGIPLYQTSTCGMTEVVLPRTGLVGPPRCYQG